MYLTMVIQSLTVKDIVTGLIKTIFFGMIIAIVGCHQGLTVKGGAEGVGKATTVSVVSPGDIATAGSSCSRLFTTTSGQPMTFARGQVWVVLAYR